MVSNIIRPCVCNCRDYIPGKPVEEVQRELGIVHVDKMASNENPLGTSPLAIKAMELELLKSNRYPESSCVELMGKLAALHGVSPGNIVVGNGLDDVITMIGMAIIDPDSEVVYADVSFPAYGNITRKMGGVCVEVPMNDKMEHDISAMADAITDRTKLVFVCNPNNPTGTICSKQALYDLIKKVPESCAIVFDEAYFHYAHTNQFATMLPEVSKRDNVIVLRTFSKIYGLAAERVGYAIASEEMVKALNKVRQPFPVNRIAQAGAMAALDDDAFVCQSLAINISGLHQYQKALDEMGLKYFDSQTNFIYLEIGKNANDVFNRMLYDGIIVRPQKVGDYPDALRITFGTEEENCRTLQSLKKTLAAL